MTEVRTLRSTTPIEQRGYARPHVLVSIDWVAERLDDPGVRLVESNEDVALYETGHIPGAVNVDWLADLNDPLTRDYIDNERLEALLRSRGINNDTTIVLYGDRNNWWATYTFWVLKLFGIEDVRLLDGGRARWAQEGRPFTTDISAWPRGDIDVPQRDDARIRAFRDEVVESIGRRAQFVDVRSPEEYRGERLHMEQYPNEGALRGGHIPGAKNVPWSRAVDPETNTFKHGDELRSLYIEGQGLRPNEPTISYCRIGERSSHTWFVLTYLLGFDDVKNYDGSWTEWGNTVRAPIER